MMDIYATRRRNLLELINRKYGGNRAAFARATGKHANLINLVLTTNEELRRKIGERLARDIEERMQLPTGWLDLQQAEPTTGNEAVTIPVLPMQGLEEEPGSTLERATFRAETLRYRMTPSTATSKLRMTYIDTPEMEPTLNPGDAILVDLGVTDLSADGIYVIRLKGTANLVRRVKRGVLGEPRLSIDSDEESSPIAPAMKVHVVGRVVGAIHFVRL
ncbi:MAG: S24/S26 family peptidase [Leucobacter sp.]